MDCDPKITNHVVGKVMDRVLIELTPYNRPIWDRIRNGNYYFKLKPIVYWVNDEGCWICFTAGRMRGRINYPVVRFNGRDQKVSRLIFEEYTGIKPGDKQVLHKCDNPACINPDHLYLGTPVDNLRDWRERGRSKYPSMAKPAYKEKTRWRKYPARKRRENGKKANVK